jgi:hypothetical protein
LLRTAEERAVQAFFSALAYTETMNEKRAKKRTSTKRVSEAGARALHTAGLAMADIFSMVENMEAAAKQKDAAVVKLAKLAGSGSFRAELKELNLPEVRHRDDNNRIIR